MAQATVMRMILLREFQKWNACPKNWQGRSFIRQVITPRNSGTEKYSGKRGRRSMAIKAK